MKNVLSFLLIFNILIMNAQNSIYDFNITTIDGKLMSLSSFKGKKMLLVNTASECGLPLNTKNYKNFIKIMVSN